MNYDILSVVIAYEGSQLDYVAVLADYNGLQATYIDREKKAAYKYLTDNDKASDELFQEVASQGAKMEKSDAMVVFNLYMKSGKICIITSNK